MVYCYEACGNVQDRINNFLFILLVKDEKA